MIEGNKLFRSVTKAFLSILPLSFGVLIYAFRPIVCRNMFGNILLCWFPDILWAMSLFLVLNLVGSKVEISFIITCICVVLFECLQAFHIINGTGDFWDAFNSIIFVIPLFFIIKGKENKNHEKAS